MKKCSKCKEVKPFSDYVRQKENADGWRGRCNDCFNAARRKKKRCPKKNRQYALKKLYGIDVEEYNDMYEEQGGCCKICNIKEEDAVRSQLFVDHCHETGAVRGLLCHHCNAGLGAYRDSPELLAKAIEYLAGY